MANKIQISTIRKVANVQVIELNANFITRVVESEFLTRNLMGAMSSTKRIVDEDAPLAVALNCWVDDLQTVWELLNGLKRVFLFNGSEEETPKEEETPQTELPENF